MDPVLWTIRLSAILYAAALLRPVRWLWTSGWLLYLAHVAAAFHFRHHWSHDAAYEDTARQTAELFGIHWGGGIYFNYLFTLVWTVDVAWWWIRPQTYARRARWIAWAVHGFMAFMFLNGVVVFPTGWVRWTGLAVAAAIGVKRLRAIFSERP